MLLQLGNILILVIVGLICGSLSLGAILYIYIGVFKVCRKVDIVRIPKVKIPKRSTGSPDKKITAKTHDLSYQSFDVLEDDYHKFETSQDYLDAADGNCNPVTNSSMISLDSSFSSTANRIDEWIKSSAMASISINKEHSEITNCLVNVSKVHNGMIHSKFVNVGDSQEIAPDSSNTPSDCSSVSSSSVIYLPYHSDASDERSSSSELLFDEDASIGKTRSARKTLNNESSLHSTPSRVLSCVQEMPDNLVYANYRYPHFHETVIEVDNFYDDIVSADTVDSKMNSLGPKSSTMLNLLYFGSAGNMPCGEKGSLNHTNEILNMKIESPFSKLPVSTSLGVLDLLHIYGFTVESISSPISRDYKFFSLYIKSTICILSKVNICFTQNLIVIEVPNFTTAIPALPDSSDINKIYSVATSFCQSDNHQSITGTPCQPSSSITKSQSPESPDHPRTCTFANMYSNALTNGQETQASFKEKSQCPKSLHLPGNCTLAKRCSNIMTRVRVIQGSSKEMLSPSHHCSDPENGTSLVLVYCNGALHLTHLQLFMLSLLPTLPRESVFHLVYQWLNNSYHVSKHTTQNSLTSETKGRKLQSFINQTSVSPLSWKNTKPSKQPIKVNHSNRKYRNNLEDISLQTMMNVDLNQNSNQGLKNLVTSSNSHHINTCNPESLGMKNSFTVVDIGDY